MKNFKLNTKKIYAKLKYKFLYFKQKDFVFIFFFKKINKNIRIFQFSKKIYLFKISIMVEPLLSGIVLGLVPVTIAGLFVTAYLQYRRGDQATW
jgi:cytochrome b6-f complex subunit 5